MFEKLSKKLGVKATDGAIEGAKQTLNDRMDKYSDIIQIGLVVAVIAFGGNTLLGRNKKKHPDDPPHYINGSGTPIVINNYYQQRTFEPNPYYGPKGAKAAHGRKAEQTRQKR